VEIPFFRARASLGGKCGLRTLYVAGAGIYVATLVVWALSSDPVTIAIARMAAGAVPGGVAYT
jgi:hypothetical protein